MKINLINIRQKLFLFLFGLIAAVILLEIGLRLLGAAYSIHDTLKNKAILTGNLDQRPVRILCLGACYTVGVGVSSEGTYPSYLGQILRQNYPGKAFVIINKAVRGKSLSFFVNNLEKLIVKYKPRIIILDINGLTNLDATNLLKSNNQAYGRWDRAKIAADNFLNRFKVYQITKMVFSSGRRAELGAESSDKLFLEGQEDGYSLKIKHYKEAVQKDPSNPRLLKKLVFAYAKRGLYEDAAKTIDQARSIGNVSFGLYCRSILFLIISGNYKEALELQKKLFTLYPVEVKTLCRNVNINAVANRILPGAVDGIKLSQQYALIGRYNEARKTAEEVILRVNNRDPHKVNYSRKQILRAHQYLPRMLDFYQVAQNIKDNTGSGSVFTSSFSSLDAGEFSEMGKDPEGFFDFEEYDVESDEKKAVLAKANVAEMANSLLWQELAEVKKIATKHGIAILIENMGSLKEQQESIKNICREMRLPLADVFEAFYNAADRKSFFLPYPSYKRLNPEGNRRMAQLIYNALIEYEILSGPEN